MLPVDEIERLRAANNIRKKALAERAGINPSTYQAIVSTKKTMPRGPTQGVLIRLEKAITELIAEKPAQPRRQI